MERAAKTFSLLIKPASADLAKIQHCLGRVYIQKGETEKAQEAFNKASKFSNGKIGSNQ